MLGRLVFVDLVRNPRRTLTTVVGVVLGVGLFCGVLFFVDGLSASMTQRAVAPLAIDMQRIVGERAGSTVILTQRFEPDGELAAGDDTTVVLDVRNTGTVDARELTVRSVPGDALAFLAGSGLVDGRAIAQSDGAPFATGAGQSGRNIGTLRPGQSMTLEYTLVADTAVLLDDDVVRSSFSTRDVVTPVPANAPDPPSLFDLADRIRGLEGISDAEPLALADLGSGTLSASNAAVAAGPAKIFGFDPSYAEHETSIDIVEGALSASGAVISAEVAAELDLTVGDSIAVGLPDGSVAGWPVSGIADLSAARSLFASRRGGDLETFVYTRNSVVVSSAVFADEVFPTFDRAAALGDERLKSPPIREVDITLERPILDADPATALVQTRHIADEINALVEGDEVLLDNISNTLAVAAQDAAVAKRLFVLLGVPGALLAAMLAAYAGSVHAEAQRREQATLRIRGAARGHLLAMLAVRTGVLTGVGSLVGLALGYGAAATVVGSESLHRASTSSLALSGAVGSAAGFLATGTALYVTGRRSIDSQINDDRRRLSDRVPLWRRLRLDVVGLVVVVVVTLLAIRSHSFEGAAGSVYFGRSVSLNLWLLVLPVSVWICGSLAGARLAGSTLVRTRPRSSAWIGRPLPSLVRLSVGRRPWAITNGALIVALIVALSTSLAAFTSSYDRAKTADARYALGADIRVTPGPTAVRTTIAEEQTALRIRGVASVSPVVAGRNNVILRSQRTSDPADLAAVEPSGFAELADDPSAVLLSREMAGFLQVDVDDSLDVLLARGTDDQVNIDMHVVGVFERLPGFSDGVDAVMSIDAHLDAVPGKPPDFYLLTTDGSDRSLLDDTVDALRAGPGATDALQIDSRASVLATDQSSLAALNVAGLVDLDAGFALAMSAVTIAIFVFGLLLQRRREYVTLRAQGLGTPTIRSLIAAEAATVAALGIAIGVAVGIGMGFYFVTVLRPLFVLAPIYSIPADAVLAPVVAVLAATVIAALAGSHAVNRLEPTELLRDE
jgi:putative ABC transport system permease protein